MAEKTVQKMVKKAADEKGKKVSNAPALVKINTKAEERDAVELLKAGIVFFGFCLGLFALPFGDSWVTRSPILLLIGSGAIFLILVLLETLGGIWWLVTGNRAFATWAFELMPFGVQPFRSAAGIPAIFIFMVVVFGEAIWLLKKNRWIAGHWLTFVSVLAGIIFFAGLASLVVPFFALMKLLVD